MNRIFILLACGVCMMTLPGACTDKSTKMNYSLPAEAYKTRLTASNPAAWNPVGCRVSVPEGGVELADGSLFKSALERNTSYLLKSFSVNHMLVPFRIRAGEKNPPDDRPQTPFWDLDLRGSNAGRFMMGAGNTLRWLENVELRNSLNELIDGIEACREPNGYILAYPPVIDSLRSEEPNYARAWFTHGLIDAGIAGNPKALGLLRGHADFFNQWDELHPKLIYWPNNSHQGHVASTRTYLSSVGKPEDLQVAEKYYVCDWWMDELTARHDSAVWQYPLQNPHSYLITSFEAYLDHYIATGDKTYLNAMLGAWDLIRDNWEHVGGSMAICENQWHTENGKRILKHWDKGHERSHPPRSYYLSDVGHTGETCGSAFWIKFNQRLHRLFPDEEKYAAEIEKSIYNVILANQSEEGAIRYHATMEGRKEQSSISNNSCCAGQGTRILGSLPEYIYSVAPDGIYVNLYEPSSISRKINGRDIMLKQETRFPFGTEVSLKVTAPEPVEMKLHIRIPSWTAEKLTVSVNGKEAATGTPGTYVELARTWNGEDQITFTLAPKLKTTKYEGIDTIPKLDRYALEYGPLLLAFVNPDGKPGGRIVDMDKIVPDASRPLYFTRKDRPAQYFMPYWLISKEPYTVYPVNGTEDADFVFENHISAPGFSVEFFDSEHHEGTPVYRGTVPSINYPDEGKRPIAPKVPVEHFSSRFTGEFVAPKTCVILFIVSTDDGYSFSVNGKIVSRSSKHTNSGAILCPVDVIQGEKYTLKLEHSQGTGDYRILLNATAIMN
jgi:DUF1680 family protein